MTISQQDVRKAASLSRIAIAEDEMEAYRAQLSRVLDLADALQKIDTTGVAPMSHPQDTTLSLRPDVVTETDQHALYQSLSSHVAESLYLVPTVIEE